MWPPTQRAFPLGTRLLAHFGGYPRAVNVWKLADGTYTRTQPTPAVVNFSTPSAAETIVHWYRGGTREEVSLAEAVALTDAGYTVEGYPSSNPLYDSGFTYDSGVLYG